MAPRGDAGAPGSGGVPGAGGAPVGGEGGELSIGGEGGGGSDPEPPDPNNKLTGDLNPYDFETGSSIWWPFGAPTHGVSEDLAHSGTKSYSATKRLNSYDSPATNITDHIVPDRVYKFTSWIAYPVASAGMQSITMKIKIVGCGSGDIYADLATGGAAVAGGTWFELTGNPYPPRRLHRPNRGRPLVAGRNGSRRSDRLRKLNPSRTI